MRRAFFICGRRILDRGIHGKCVWANAFLGEGVSAEGVSVECVRGKDTLDENALGKDAFGHDRPGRRIIPIAPPIAPGTDHTDRKSTDQREAARGPANRRTNPAAADPRSRPDRHIGRTGTDSAGLRISHENPVVTANRQIATSGTHIADHAPPATLAGHSRGPHTAGYPRRHNHEPRPNRNAVSRGGFAPDGLRIRPGEGGDKFVSDKSVNDEPYKQNLEKAGQRANKPAGCATTWQPSRGDRYCGNRYQEPESSGIGHWRHAPATVIRKIRRASPGAPGTRPRNVRPRSRNHDTSEPRFLDVF